MAVITAEVHRPVSDCCGAGTRGLGPGAATCACCGQPCETAYGPAEQVPLQD